jgi:AcrR family transcriptional regulator
LQQKNPNTIGLSPTPPRRREAHRHQRIAAIRHAATQLFRQKGFDATTTRQIADAVGVPLATLFTYASDKRDLLVLCVIDSLEALQLRAFTTIPSNLPLLDQLTYVFSRYYEFFQDDAEIGRLVLREMFFAGTGPSIARLYQDREVILADLAHLVGQARATGEVQTATDDLRCASAIFAIYSAEIRRWIAQTENRSLAQGVAELRQLLRLVVRGLARPAVDDPDRDT